MIHAQKIPVSKIRKIKSHLMIFLIMAAFVMAVLPLFAVFFHVVVSGAPALNLDFFTQLPGDMNDPHGGMAHAIVGSLKMVALAACIGIPMGLACGIYLSEYSVGKIAASLRMAIDLLATLPSIVVGLFIYTIVVAPMKSFSALAGSLALAFLMVPPLVKTTEEVLRLLPGHVREAGLALGIPRWRVILSIVLRGSIGGVVTGVVLALARVLGETAPLLFTAFGNRSWSGSLLEPTASLPVQIYSYAISPYENWHRQAWAGAFVLVGIVFTVNLLARIILRKRN